MKVTLTTKNPSRLYYLEGENRYFKITGVEFPPEKNTLPKGDIESIRIPLVYRLKGSDGKIEEHTLFSSISEIKQPNQKDIFYKFERVLCNDKEHKFNTIELFLKYAGDFEVTMDVYYYWNELISLDDPWQKFETHLDDPIVTKILFSSPFGTGKTTFLNKYFEDERKNNTVFHLFPVNYSISQNEDAFQYIKAEILFQLLGKDIEFDKEDFSKALTFPEYLKENIDTILLPFLRLIPKVGGDVHSVISDLIKIKNDFITYDDQLKIDDKKRTLTYIKEIYEKEGSIYEDNFFTQLIRQLLEQLKLKTRKKNVLIIDDMDRMDPEHIFRILNVFAAHFDTPSNSCLGIANKFGFDKIIIVCDYENLKKIFAHKYGPNTDFTGYIDKYYSKQVFFYDNTKAMLSIADKIHGFEDVSRNENLECFIIILKDLILTKSITLREVLHLKKFNYTIFFSNYMETTGYRIAEFDQILASPYFNYPFFVSLYFLSKIAGEDNAIDMISLCFANIKIDNNALIQPADNYNELAKLCLISLNYTGGLGTETHTKRFKDIPYSFSIERSMNRFNFLYKTEPQPVFTAKDFYSLLIDVATKYKEIGGITGSNARR